MKSVWLLIAFCCAITLYFILSDKSNSDTMKHIAYCDAKKKSICAETNYIPDYNSTFVVCSTKDGIPPCKEIHGIKHGMEKWYSNGTLKYEEEYEHGNLQSLVEYYSDGLKKRQELYHNGKLDKELFYNKDQMNQLVKMVLHRNDEVLKRYYVNNKVVREEKYQNGALVSRKQYDGEGRLYQLEEYGSIRGPLDLFDELYSGNKAKHQPNSPESPNINNSKDNANDMWI